MLNKILNELDIKRFAQMIDDATNIVLTCHVRPDGDAIGSTLGLWHILRGLGKNATVLLPDGEPRSLRFLPGSKELVPYTRYADYAERLVAEADLMICCDFNKPSRQDKLEPLVQGAKCPKVLIDHHQFPDAFADLTFSYPHMSSTCELVFRIVCAMGLYPEMSLDAATCLCAGLITDTRNLSVNSSNPEIYLIMVELLKKGVDKTRIVKETLETKSYDSVKLHAFAIYERLKMYPRHHTAIVSLSTADLDRFNYERGDTEGLVNEALQIQGVTASYFLRQDPDCIKISARSIDDFPVSEVCEDLFGGGGHRQAAGGEFNGTLEQCIALLEENMPRYDKYLKTNKTQNETVS